MVFQINQLTNKTQYPFSSENFLACFKCELQAYNIGGGASGFILNEYAKSNQ